MMTTNLDGKSKNILEDNINKLKELFPEILTEDKIDFDKLKSVLTNEVDESPERYNFTWAGKSKSIAEAQKPSTGTLRPCKEESKDWDTTKNLYIEGDNLEVLKLLQKSYYDKIKMIYIDPPYNTGKDFIYPDSYKDNLENYLKMTGQVSNLEKRENNGFKLSTNTETSGRFHTTWLNMMYPRLKLARNLLTDDGIIFISIDDNEQSNLKKICDEIFGESNFLGEIICLKGNAQNDAQNIQQNHDYALCYKKTNGELFLNIRTKKEVFKESNDYYYEGSPLVTGGVGGTLNARPNLGYTIYYNPKTKEKIAIPDYNLELAKISNDEAEVYEDKKELLEKNYIKIRAPKKGPQLGCWTWALDKFNKEKDSILIKKTKNAYTPIKKVFVNEKDVYEMKGHFYYNFIRKSPLKSFVEISSALGTKETSDLFDKHKFFDFPKATKLIEYFFKCSISMDDTILDFFSGSGTTAHSLLKLNSKDNGNRKFIMVQIPESTDEKSEAYKSGYKTIDEIGKERIRRAGEKIKSESNNKNLDIGFKVFKLDSSNLNKWNPDYNDLEQTLIDSTNNLVEGRTELDLVYEIMLKYGVDLTLAIDEFNINDKNVYSIGYGSLLICLDDNITKEIAIPLIELKNKLSPETSRIVFKDNGFASDSDKTNIKESLKTNNIDEFITI
ncbi:MAG: site-specific DNA-methyltransferase [Methanobrevibacter sp.]|jgi:adenine-specific DNA-methyltransferase|nr:site-specific DNA-methyltransferase [Methanobrevibacter sp.]